MGSGSDGFCFSSSGFVGSGSDGFCFSSSGFVGAGTFGASGRQSRFASPTVQVYVAGFDSTALPSLVPTAFTVIVYTPGFSNTQLAWVCAGKVCSRTAPAVSSVAPPLSSGSDWPRPEVPNRCTAPGPFTSSKTMSMCSSTPPPCVPRVSQPGQRISWFWVCGST